MSIHRFQPDPDVPTYCKCGLHRDHAEHATLDQEALSDLYNACKRVLANLDDIPIGAIEDMQAAVKKAEGRS